VKVGEMIKKITKFIKEIFIKRAIKKQIKNLKKKRTYIY
jgi:hypothetical protein